MRRYFYDWLETLDPDGRKSATAPGAWVSLAVITAVGLFIAGAMPGAREFFRLDYLRAGLCFLPAFALGVVGGTLQQRNRLSLKAHGILLLIGSFLYQSFMWSLVSYSELPGATVMAAFPVLQAAFQGHLLHVTPRHPFGLFAAAAALAFGIAINRQADHFAIFALAGPMALASNMLLGTFSMTDYRARVERAALRAAVDAQLLNEQGQEARRLSSPISSLRGRHHDAGNALSGALVNLNMLAMKAGREQLDADACRAISEMARDSLESLDRLRNLLEEARVEGRTAAPAVPFDMLAGVEGAIRDAQHRYPRVVFDRDIQCGNSGFTTSQFTLFGGELTFARMLSNLLLNACQGDGQSGASRVRVAVSVAECGQSWELRVSDDGPGFSQAQIGGPIVGFQTTKASGTGLGLFVVERLAAANGGVVRRGNNTQGGAWVSLSFAQQMASA